ncbi:MAG: hypothetical protein Q8Q02_13685 [Nocardioides sp.]|nr:hypothetical protein [Nocardioides sp.]
MIAPTWLAAAGLTGFSAALMRVYLKTPGLIQDDEIHPAPAGIGIARDIFMLGSRLGLLIDELTDRPRTRMRQGFVEKALIKR